MSGSTSVNVAEKVSRRQQAAEWFNDVFKTRLEKDAKKLEELMKASNDNEVRGDTTFYYTRGGLEKQVQARLSSAPRFVKLGDLSVTYWCDVPKKLWKEFKDDAKFNSDLYDQVNTLTDKLVVEWSRCVDGYEKDAAAADARKDKKGVEAAKVAFQKDCADLQDQCRDAAIAGIADFFAVKVKAYGDYKRYKVKAGAKLAFTFVGIVASIAALSTAATPAAPATIVPAIIGLTVAIASAGKQIRDLAISAETVAKELEGNLTSLQCSYLDDKGKPRKKFYKAKDLSSGFVSGLTGGWSEVKFPSVKSLMGLTDTHKSKLDGLEVRLHELGIGINAIVDSLIAADKVIEDNLAALKEAAKRKVGAALQKAGKALDAARQAFAGVNADFLRLFNEDIPRLAERIKDGLSKNGTWKVSLERINQALGSKNWATAGNLFATLALTGIGFSSGAPSNLAETIMLPVTLGVTVADTLREYTPEVMDAILSGKEA